MYAQQKYRLTEGDLVGQVVTLSEEVDQHGYVQVWHSATEDLFTVDSLSLDPPAERGAVYLLDIQDDDITSPLQDLYVGVLSDELPDGRYTVQDLRDRDGIREDVHPEWLTPVMTAEATRAYIALHGSLQPLLAGLDEEESDDSHETAVIEDMPAAPTSADAERWFDMVELDAFEPVSAEPATVTLVLDPLPAPETLIIESSAPIELSAAVVQAYEAHQRVRAQLEELQHQQIEAIRAWAESNPTSMKQQAARLGGMLGVSEARGYQILHQMKKKTPKETRLAKEAAEAALAEAAAKEEAAALAA